MLLSGAALYGYTKLITMASKWGDIGNGYTILGNAAIEGDLRCMVHVRKLIGVSGSSLHYANREAAIAGKLRAIWLIQKWEYLDFGTILEKATQHGHYRIAKFAVRHMKSWGDINVVYLYWAVEGGRSSIVKMIWKEMSKNTKDLGTLDYAFCHAAKVGQLKAMRILRKWGARDYNMALKWAIENGQTAAAKLAIKFGAKT